LFDILSQVRGSQLNEPGGLSGSLPPLVSYLFVTAFISRQINMMTMKRPSVTHQSLHGSRLNGVQLTNPISKSLIMIAASVMTRY